MPFVCLASQCRRWLPSDPPHGDALALDSELSSCILRLMKVNLLPGTCTPTLTPMPGVHNPFHLTAARVRIGTTANGCDRAAAGDWRVSWPDL